VSHCAAVEDGAMQENTHGHGQRARRAARDSVAAAGRTVEYALKHKEPLSVLTSFAEHGSTTNDKDWNGAIHLHTLWADVPSYECNRYLGYRMRFCFHLRDVYDWDIHGNGSALWFLGVMDWMVGRLHYYGLAKAYKVTATICGDFSWNGEGKMPQTADPDWRGWMPPD
jgi:hypothetical protein